MPYRILILPAYLLVVVQLFWLPSCSSGHKRTGMHFTNISAAESGIDFSNNIVEDDSLNMFTNEYTYMGGGVGVGDFNRDGLPDLFFSGNQVSSRLYINTGRFRFTDITEQAGVGTSGWCTGVSVVDVNNDDWPDLYISVSGKVPAERRRNKLFINQHNLTFREAAAEYGLDDSSYSTQAVFFDYDLDGRLDMYLLNHTLADRRPNDIRDKKTDSSAVAGDRLYHNDGVPRGMQHPVFKDVSKPTGIFEDGNGLGVAISDFNGDGYPDIYVANDYIRNDLLWLNDSGRGFHNVIASAIKHQAYSSMGTDVADLNNDAMPDIVNLDMQPETNRRKKMMYSFLSNQRHQLEMEKGYEPEYIHNMLQLNNGTRSVSGAREPFFSEIGQMAGIAETDWSWSALIADFDDDGWKDLHITNGTGRDPTNIDFLEYRRNTFQQTHIPESAPGQRQNLISHLAALGSVPLHDYLYRNTGQLMFDDVSTACGIGEPSVSTGAAYADLDNDGDLDLVVSNINAKPFLFKNDSRSDARDTAAPGSLTVSLRGSKGNTRGIGARIFVYAGGTMQSVEQFPVRGYLSSVDDRLHVGIAHHLIDSVRIIWPDFQTQLTTHIPDNRNLELHYDEAKEKYVKTLLQDTAMFHVVNASSGIDFRHRETGFYDYSFQPLIPQKFSQEGPFLSVADIDGDGREDLFSGGAFGQSGKFFLQRENHTFSAHDLVSGAKNEEDMQSVFFDANGDNKTDLLIVSGSSEFDLNSPFYRPRLYLGDGRGGFRQDSLAFPPDVRTPAKALAIADIDGDGDQDVFIGGRISLGQYPFAPPSFLLRNDQGHFSDITDAFCPALRHAGMINSAAWFDVDLDKKPDLVIGGDWMPLRLFKNDGHGLHEITQPSGLTSVTGFWRAVVPADLDGDGDTDILAGNMGLNNSFHIKDDRPATLHAKDMDGNGIVEPIFCFWIKDEDGNYRSSVGISRDDWAVQMPAIKRTYDHNEPFAKASMNEIFAVASFNDAKVLNCSEPRSGWFENKGSAGFLFRPFPLEAQRAPINTMVVTDANGDHHADIVLAGNEYQSDVMAGRYDASYGLLMTGDGAGNFTPVTPARSGLILDGDIRDLRVLKVSEYSWLVAAANDGPVTVWDMPRSGSGTNGSAPKSR